MIPYRSASEITFVDQDNSAHTARTEPLVIERSVMDNCADCCEDIEVESAINEIQFNNNRQELSILLRTTEFSTNFRILYREIDRDAGIVTLLESSCIEEYTEGRPLDDYVTDLYKGYGFEFTNVLVLNDCIDPLVPESNLKLETIVFSPENGIELVGFKDGTYLKLQQ